MGQSYGLGALTPTFKLYPTETQVRESQSGKWHRIVIDCPHILGGVVQRDVTPHCLNQ